MICGNCKAHTDSVSAVKACYAEAFVPCGELVSRGYDEFGTIMTEECGAHCTINDRGWFCEYGHSYINMETRWRERIEYSDDPDEAAALAGMGITVIRTGGIPIQL
jgi:hypothetical protein